MTLQEWAASVWPKKWEPSGDGETDAYITRVRGGWASPLEFRKGLEAIAFTQIPRPHNIIQAELYAKWEKRWAQ